MKSLTHGSVTTRRVIGLRWCMPALLFAAGLLAQAEPAAAQFAPVQVYLSNVDDTAEIWRWNPSWQRVVHLDQGEYPRSGWYTLTPPPGYVSGWVPFYFRLGNGGGGWSDGSMSLSI